MNTASLARGLPRLPDTPGVYLFRDKYKNVLYIGKAKNLKSRVKSYYSGGLAAKTAQMIAGAHYLSTVEVESEFAALLLEAGLVKKYMPKYNSELKDDKSPIYIIITKEEFPRILSVRKTRISELPVKYIHGPFPDGKTAGQVLRYLRRVFSFAHHVPAKRPCLYNQLGLCYPCPSAIIKMDNINRNKAKQEYLKNIQNVNKTLSGKLPSVLRTLEREMSIYAQHEDFESATRRRNQLNQLLSIARTDNTEVYINNPNFIEDVRTQEIDDLTDLLCPHLKFTNLLRIECFDVAHLAGTFPTASMVTFVNGEPDKRFYRHFKVSSGQQKSDFESIRSVISRRAKHFIDWGTPDLIIVDGGKSQVTAAYKSLGDRIPIVGAAKRRETLVIPTSDGFFEIKLNDGPALHLISRLRDEAHRFARRYHHKLVARALRASSVGR